VRPGSFSPGFGNPRRSDLRDVFVFPQAQACGYHLHYHFFMAQSSIYSDFREYKKPLTSK
jgi:hypothetical protein